MSLGLLETDIGMELHLYFAIMDNILMSGAKLRTAGGMGLCLA